MREINFRAWDVEHKVMTPVANISFGDDGAALTLIFETAPRQKFYRGLVNSESGILMQFTGLKDKNGKEIYEGDIVRVLGVYGGAYRKEYVDVSVGWHPQAASFRYITKDGENESLLNYDEPEVIGNIYENPDLLKA